MTKQRTHKAVAGGTPVDCRVMALAPKRTKPSRAALLRTLESVQVLVGIALGAHENDRSQTAHEEASKALASALDLCIEARSFDPPPRMASRRAP